MGLTPYTGATDIIASLATYWSERGLTGPEMQAKFDEGLKTFVEWFNGTFVRCFNDEWTEYTPEVAALSGTLTSYTATGRYKQIGSVVYINIKIEITDNGTGASAVTATLPVTARPGATQVIAGRENALSGKMLQALIDTGFMTIRDYWNDYPGATGALLYMSGAYEAYLT